MLTELVFGGLQLDHSPRAFLLKFVFSHGLTGPESPELWGKVLCILPEFDMGKSEEMVMRPSG